MAYGVYVCVCILLFFNKCQGFVAPLGCLIDGGRIQQNIALLLGERCELDRRPL